MTQFEDNEIVARIRAHAFNALSAVDRPRVNLHLDHKIYSKGEKIGPAFQKLVAPKSSILVFADDNPLANFGHDCRYLLYDPKTAEPHTVLPARFPPFATSKPETLKPFHEPVRIQPVSTFRIWPIWRCPIIIPDGERYAVLYSGMSNMRHLNDLEFCYRMLIDRYAFKPANIFVLNYNGTLNTQDGPGVTWPGDSTAYRIQVTGQGNRAGFQGALNAIKLRIQSRDLLFIHTNNHGDNFGSGSFLCTYPILGHLYVDGFLRRFTHPSPLPLADRDDGAMQRRRLQYARYRGQHGGQHLDRLCRHCDAELLGVTRPALGFLRTRLDRRSVGTRSLRSRFGVQSRYERRRSNREHGGLQLCKYGQESKRHAKLQSKFRGGR